MNLLVIGGAGFLGSNLVRRCLREEDVTITVLDSLDPHFHSRVDNLQSVWDRIQFVRGDIRDEHLIAELVQDKDVIYNCAAQTSHPLSIQFPLLDADINCVGNLKLLEAVRLLNREAIVVFASSSTVIGKAQSEVVDENHGEKPLEIYSANKGVAEKYYRIYHTLHGLNTVVLRFANLYGPFGKGFPEFGFINYFIHLAWSSQQISVFGPGTQTRNVTYVADAVEALWLSARAPRLYGETCFATSNEHLPILEIAERIVDVMGRGSVSHVEWPDERRRIEIESVRFSSQRLSGMIDWKPRYDFTSGLADTRKQLESQQVKS